jgi:hypothetical protein
VLCGSLVFFMQAGFALLETGLSRAKNAANVIMKNYTDVCVASVVFWLIGYSMFTRTVLETLEDGKARVAPPLNAGNYQSALNGIYIALCDSYGPVKSDRLLSDSMKKVDASKFGRAYSPTNFL